VTEAEITGPVPGTATLAGAPHVLPGGYVEEEFFLSGTASAYAACGELGSDGRWQVEPADSAEFVTRLLVRRPADAARHGGTVVVEWLNVSAGTDAAPEWSLTHRHLGRAGMAWVGVSAQRVGVAGGGIAALGAPLQQADPRRYGRLVHPGDAWSFDIFTQAALAVRAGAGVLGPLRADRLIGAGVSQSAAHLVTYLNAVAPHTRAFDAYLVHSRGGGCPPLSGMGVGADGTVDLSPMSSGDIRIRDDLTVPVLTLQTETDLIMLGFAGARQPDTGLLRLWEVAGTAHADTYLRASGVHGDDTTIEELARLCAPITTPMGPHLPTEIPVNSGPQHHYVAQAALAHLDRWVREGEPAPTAPRLGLTDDRSGLVTDELGVARGGIRTGFVDVPAAVLSGLGQSGAVFAFLFGTTRAFDDATLRRLYPGGRDEYAKRFADATAQAVADGFVLAADVEEMNALAVAMFAPG
jgi:hypothetical protein